MLSRDVIPKNLGLVIVDEEQRFGVAQKELLRPLRLEVDVLALTATPIPRTLHMSLSGLRDISMIETPPEGRRPIRTYVGEYDEELDHARRSSASSSAAASRSTSTTASRRSRRRPRSSQELCPELRFLVAHGQMPERELEQRMLAFLRGDADVLVSTTIIESGLDIPQANTLVVERADMLGLAQLYQIRGRVGRSDVPAHAYLFYPDAQELTPEARARLATLADHTELGAGFAIAMRDLEIRGAGELLGAEQSGHVAAVGFELYVELLDEAVAELERPAPSGRAPGPGRRADRRLRAGRLHRRPRRRRSTCTGGSRSPETEDELRELHAALEDRYGPLPEPVENLFAIQEARAEAGPDRRRLPRVPRRQAHGRSARARLGRAARPPRPTSTPPSTRAPEARVRYAGATFAQAAPTARCYPRAPPRSLRRTRAQAISYEHVQRRILLIVAPLAALVLGLPAAAAAASDVRSTRCAVVERARRHHEGRLRRSC